MKLVPAVKENLWGGTKLKKDFNKQTNGEIIAECWELSCHKEGESIVANGYFKGQTLSDILDKNPNMKGENCKKFEMFPILIKLIDAETNLSIQVHPSDEYALANEGQYGKSEMWYIVDAEENAGVYCGFKRKLTPNKVAESLTNGNILDELNFIQIKKGDCIFIPAGTVHAICGGVLICEIQQNSSLTYRLFDYNRVDKNGKTRELHIDKAMNVINCESVCSPNSEKKIVSKGVVQLAKCKYFEANELSVTGEMSLVVTDKSFVSLTVVEGFGSVKNGDESLEVIKGDTIFLPAGSGSVSLIGQMTIVSAEV